MQIPIERKVKEEQDKPGKNPDTNKSITVSGNSYSLAQLFLRYTFNMFRMFVHRVSTDSSVQHNFNNVFLRYPFNLYLLIYLLQWIIRGTNHKISSGYVFFYLQRTQRSFIPATPWISRPTPSVRTRGISLIPLNQFKCLNMHFHDFFYTCWNYRVL